MSLNKDMVETNVGRIPVDWGLTTFGEVFEFLRSYSFSRSQLTYELSDDSIYNIHYGDLHTKFEGELLDFSTEEIPVIIDSGKLPTSVDYLKDGDLVIADASEDYEGVGECIELINLHDKRVTGGSHTFAVRDKIGKTVLGYRSYIFKNETVRKNLKKIATGISVYGISKTNLSKLTIPLPPRSEQEKIAEILGTWDEAIGLTERLIALEEQRKKGLMQRLLTGQVRFPEFVRSYEMRETKFGEIPADWEVKSLKHIGEFHRGSGISKSQLVDEGIPCIRYGEIYTTHHFQIKDFHSFISPETAEKSRPIFSGDLLFASSGETLEDIGKCVAYTGNEVAYAGGDIIILRTTTGDTNYLGYLFNHDIVNRQMHKLGQGHSVVHIYPSQLINVSVPLPPIEEQRKIAAVLQTCDEKIALLQQKLAALQQQKKGLMQRLLTGRVRVRVSVEKSIVPAQKGIAQRLSADPIAHWVWCLLGYVYAKGKYPNLNKLQLQKRTYFLTQELDEELQADYIAHTYGPYSPKLDKTLRRMVDDGQLVTMKKGRGTYYSLPEPLLTQVQAYLDARPELVQVMDFVQELVADPEVKGDVGTLASVHFVKQREPELDVAGVVERFYEWGKKMGGNKTDVPREDIVEALTRLEAFGLLSPSSGQGASALG